MLKSNKKRPYALNIFMGDFDGNGEFSVFLLGEAPKPGINKMTPMVEILLLVHAFIQL